MSRIDIALRTSIVTVGVSQALGMITSFGSKMRKTKAIHLKIQEIVDAAPPDGTDVTDMYWMNEQKCRKFTKIMCVYTCFLQTAFVTAFVHAIYDICNGKFDTSMWDLPFNLVVPFNTKTVYGWFIEWFFQFNVGNCYLISNFIPTTYFACFCNYIVAICKHFDLLLKSIHMDAGLLQLEETLQEQQQLWRNVKEKLNQAVEVQVKIHEIYKLAADVSTGVIFFLLPPTALVLGLSIYTMERSEFDFVVFAMDVVCLICALIWASIFCYFANSTTDRVAAIGEAAYDLNWFDHPVEMQKYMILIIGRSQEPAHFSGLNLIRCTLEVFGKLLKSACSIYLIFRSLSQH